MDEIIKPQDISVVLQGPIDQDYTPICIKSIRKYLPQSEIIISTWKDNDVGLLEYDKLVLNEDPGCSFDDIEYSRAFNLNRWIVSSREGVKTAQRKYVLKCRTDCEIVGCDFLTYWNKYEKRDKEYIISDHKIIIPSPYTLKYLGDKKKRKCIETPFHVSDWYCFGLKNDILEFVSCPIIDKLDSFARYYETRSYYIPYDTKWWMDNWLRKMAPEQYIGLSFVKRKFPDVDIKDVFNFINFDLSFAEKILVNNFIVLDPMQYGIILNKYKEFSKNIFILEDYLWKGMYRNCVYQKIYSHYFKTSDKRKLDILDLQHKLHKIKLILLEVCKRGLNKIRKIKKEVHLWVNSKPLIHIVSFTYIHVFRGYFIYKRIRKQFLNNKDILVCPFRGTGDSYIIGNYYRYKKMVEQYNFIVLRETNKILLEIFGIKHIVVISEKESKYLQEFQRIMKRKDLRIIHYANPYEQGNTGYNVAAYKKINFADFYDYIVFGEETPILYEKIIENSGDDYSKKYGIKKGMTVLLAPYSDSIDSMDTKEWEYMAKLLKQKGFLVLTNCVGNKEKPIKGTKAINLSFKEIGPFLEWAGYFISVRSGLCDIVSAYSVRKIIFYPKFINYKYGNYKDFFSLNLPERNLVAEEYEYARMKNQKTIRKMIETLP